jgi:hypothetical protein
MGVPLLDLVALSDLRPLGVVGSTTMGENLMIDWTGTASRLKYPSEEAMWTELYDRQKLSIAQLATRLGLSRNAVRIELAKRGVHVRGRGGANNAKLTLTNEVLEEIRQEGVMAVAKRMGLNYTTMYKRLRKMGVTVAELRSATLKENA